MKFFLKLVCAFFIVSSITSCSRGSDNNRNNNTSSLKAAIALDMTCIQTITFEDLNDDVYAYRADHLFGVPSIQTGGHSTSDLSTDLGVNIFGNTPLAANLLGTFPINAGSGISGTAYVYYFDGLGNQYISTAANTENLVVESIDLSLDGDTVNSITCKFNNVEVANISDNEDKLCINAFELIFILN